MSRPDHLFVFAYDVERDSARTKLAELLSEVMDRVQLSVFEGRMTTEEARKLSKRAGLFIGARDSLRIYCVTADGIDHCSVVGAGVPPESDDFVLI